MATKKTTAKPKASAPIEAVLTAVAEIDTLDAVEADQEAKGGPQLRSKEFLERVAVATDLNKNKVRAIVEATLAELGKALDAGEPLNLSGLGKVRIVNTKAEDFGSILTLKLRRAHGKEAGSDEGKEALAEASEAS
jgi:hypothetical protein